MMPNPYRDASTDTLPPIAIHGHGSSIVRNIPASQTAHWSASSLDVDQTIALGRWLQTRSYRFTTATPCTHRRVLANAGREARDLRDVFGWSRPFHSTVLPPDVLSMLERCGGLQILKGGLNRSRIRFSSVGEQIFVHSAYPTVAGDSVFFGPDTYRFIDLIRRTIAARAEAPTHVVDIGCGSGAGGLAAAFALARQDASSVVRTTLGDISPAALRCAEINATLADIEATCVSSDVLRGVRGRADLILSNPPYLADAEKRIYRDGGGAYGCELSLRIVREAIPKLAANGQLVVYTGTAIVDGVDTFRAAVEPLLQSSGCRYVYDEIDPDVFGEELEQPAYAAVERIAVVGLVVESPRRATAPVQQRSTSGATPGTRPRRGRNTPSNNPLESI